LQPVLGDRDSDFAARRHEVLERDGVGDRIFLRAIFSAVKPKGTPPDDLPEQADSA